MKNKKCSKNRKRNTATISYQLSHLFFDGKNRVSSFSLNGTFPWILREEDETLVSNWDNISFDKCTNAFVSF